MMGAMTGIGTEGLGTANSLGRLPRGSGVSVKTEEPGRGRWKILKTLRGELLISFIWQVTSCLND